MPERVTTTVLVVEDDPGDVRRLEAALDGAGRPFSITGADRLSIAVEWLRHASPDVVLLDLDLPDSRGLETLVVLRTRAPRVPIVVLRGAGLEDGPRALRSGAGAYLVKSDLTTDRLLSAIDSAMTRQRVLNQVQAGE